MSAHAFARNVGLSARDGGYQQYQSESLHDPVLIFSSNGVKTNGMAIATINPANGEMVRTFEALSSAEVDAKIQTAFDAFHALRRTSFADRAAKMRKAGDILERRRTAGPAS